LIQETQFKSVTIKIVSVTLENCKIKQKSISC
jgi:hypothetical protein